MIAPETGRSDARPLPRSSAQIVSELHDLLGAAGELPPYIVVGHSFGSYNMRLFADRYLDEVAGIVLVDGSHEFSPALNASLLEAARAPKQYAASLGEAELFRTQSAADVRRARRSFGDIPLRILTGTRHFGDSAAPAQRRAVEQRCELGWQALQRTWLGLSSNARQTVARHSGHNVQLDEPQLVIDPIREEIALSRKPRY